KSGDHGDVTPRVKLRAITAEVLDDVSSVAEEIHDVANIACARQSQGVAELVQAGQVDNRVSQQIVCRGALRDVRPERFHIRPDENGGSVPAVDEQRLSLAVFAASWFGPVKPNERSGLAGRFE